MWMSKLFFKTFLKEQLSVLSKFKGHNTMTLVQELSFGIVLARNVTTGSCVVCNMPH